MPPIFKERLHLLGCVLQCAVAFRKKVKHPDLTMTREKDFLSHMESCTGSPIDPSIQTGALSALEHVAGSDLPKHFRFVANLPTIVKKSTSLWTNRRRP